MRQPAAGGIHGFIIHDACWSLLQMASKPASLSLERLVCVCESLPFPLWSNGVSWGHDYEGLLKLDVDGKYPWLEHFFNPSIQDLYDMGAIIDPFDDSHFSNILRPTMPDRPRTLLPAAERANCFSRLSPELLDLIIMYLPTKDALNLRLVSRSFLPLFENLAFWLTRFESDHERGFLFELRNVTTVNDVDTVLNLYRASQRSVAAPGLLNRSRVWSLARRLVSLTQLSLVKNVSSQPTNKLNCKDWARLAGEEQQPIALEKWEMFERGCRPNTTIDIEISSNTVKFGIFKINTGIWDYVTGIRIVDQDGHEQTAGYMLDNNETVCDITAFHGLRVAMGPSGVRALQVVGKEQQSSSWVGRAEGVPRSERLMMRAPVEKLSITLDNYKITALAVSRPGQTCDIRPARMNLRHTALWYPDIPPDDLLFNEISFTGLDPLAGYQPLSWIHFGGPSGKNLAHVRGILVQSSYSIHGLQIVYDETVERHCSAKLGPIKEEPLSSGPLFTIDGAGGEHIDSVRVGLRHFQHPEVSSCSQRRALECITITTNQRRTTCIGKQVNDLEFRTVDIARGTTITGFYGHYDATYGMMSLGVISEPTMYS